MNGVSPRSRSSASPSASGQSPRRAFVTARGWLAAGLVVAGLAGAGLACSAPSAPPADRGGPPPSPGVPSDPSVPRDPAVARLALLARLDAQIDAAAARAHLEARLALDETMPLPYLGVDADPDGDGMRVAHVYPLTAAEASGLRAGDRLLALSGVPVSSKATLGAAIRSHAVGQPVTLDVVRDGQALKLTAPLGARPEEDEDEAEQFPDLYVPPVFATDPVAFDFESEPAACAPAAFEPQLGGHGAPPEWVLAGAGEGQVLRQQSADPTGIRFPLALVRGFRAADVTGRVRFRFAGGRVDRAAGIVLRYRGPSDYLVARANAAEGDLRIFRVANGLRRTLPGAMAKAPCDDDRWHELVFRAHGTELTASLDGTAEVATHDAWFLEGGVGVWTKSDSVTEFDDLRFEPTAP